MPVIFDSDGKLYSTLTYNKESDFERAVVELADKIFGPETIYIDIKKRVSGNDLVTIPDGYLIDMTVPDNPKLFIIENEIVSHDPFKHIGVQLLKFATQFSEGSFAIKESLIDYINNSKETKEKFNSLISKSEFSNISEALDFAIYKND